MLSQRRTDGRAVLGLAAAALVPFLLVVVVVGFGVVFPDAWAPVFQAMELLVAGGLGVVLMAEERTWPGGLLRSLRQATPIRCPTLRDLPPIAVVTAVGFGFSLLYVGFLSAGIRTVWPALGEMQDAAADRSLPLAELISVLVIAPLGEEWLCRGVIYRAADRVGGGRVAVAVSAFTFGFLHVFNGLLLLEIPHRWVMGVLYGGLRWRTGSLWPGVIAHGLHNLLAVTLP